jgi:hypothetical protein
LKACSSFKQLLDAHDPEITGYFEPNAHRTPIIYFCFRPNEDSFVIFAPILISDEVSWKPVPGGQRGEQRELSIAWWREYRGGLKSFTKLASGHWRRFAGSDAEPTFASDPFEEPDPGDLKVVIGPDEIDIKYSYQTSRIVNGELTLPFIEHSMKIRRSTGRYIESEDLTRKASGSCLIYR